ncbi:hypothetical protein [Aureibaculum luteum]|uniref:hypothetical protein n=1 Tax=Aureibaculum luteum TaxID=1548456 RepID=UPI000E54D66C|nr:hypothetical protein [Aureibaculum luteum]
MHSFIHSYLAERKFEIVKIDEEDINSPRYRRYFDSTPNDSEMMYCDIVVFNNSIMIQSITDRTDVFDLMSVARSYRVDNLEQLKFLLNNANNVMLDYFKKIDYPS